MKYHHSPIEAREILQQALALLDKLNLSCNPINYAVVYQYISKGNQRLAEDFERALQEGQVDPYLVETLYEDYIKEPTKFQGESIEQLGQSVETIKVACDSSSQAIDELENEVEQVKQREGNVDPALMKLLEQTTKTIRANQAHLSQCVAEAKQQTEQIQLELEQARLEALTDTLTSLRNRKGLKDYYCSYVSDDRAAPFASVVLDIDHFKSINDNFGHLIGDVILRRLAKLLVSLTEEVGEAFRFGGEEFVLLLPACNKPTACALAESIRAHVAKLRFVHAKTKEKLPPITISLGVSLRQGEEDMEVMIQRADEALYRAKNAGRNQVQVG